MMVKHQVKIEKFSQLSLRSCLFPVGPKTGMFQDNLTLDIQKKTSRDFAHPQCTHSHSFLTGTSSFRCFEVIKDTHLSFLTFTFLVPLSPLYLKTIKKKMRPWITCMLPEEEDHLFTVWMEHKLIIWQDTVLWLLHLLTFWAQGRCALYFMISFGWRARGNQPAELQLRCKHKTKREVVGSV